jgi:hypothetical protein
MPSVRLYATCVGNVPSCTGSPLPKATRAHWTSKVSTRAIGAAHPLADGLKNGFVTGLLPLLHVCSHFSASGTPGRVNCLAAALLWRQWGMHVQLRRLPAVRAHRACIDVLFPRFVMKARVFAAAPAAFAVFSTFLSSLAGGPGFGAAVVCAAVGFAAHAQHCTAQSQHCTRRRIISPLWAGAWVCGVDGARVEGRKKPYSSCTSSSLVSAISISSISESESVLNTNIDIDISISWFRAYLTLRPCEEPYASPAGVAEARNRPSTCKIR